MATDEADSDNKFSPEDYGEEDKENNEADVEFEFEMKSDSDSDRLRPVAACFPIPSSGEAWSRPRYENAPGIARRRRHIKARHTGNHTTSVGSEQHPGGRRLGGANAVDVETRELRRPGAFYYKTSNS